MDNAEEGWAPELCVIYYLNPSFVPLFLFPFRLCDASAFILCSLSITNHLCHSVLLQPFHPLSSANSVPHPFITSLFPSSIFCPFHHLFCSMFLTPVPLLHSYLYLFNICSLLLASLFQLWLLIILPLVTLWVIFYILYTTLFAILLWAL